MSLSSSVAGAEVGLAAPGATVGRRSVHGSSRLAAPPGRCQPDGMPSSSLTALADPTAELARRAAHQRPDLETAFGDDGWVAVRIDDVLLTSAGFAFAAGDVALARPAVARHPSDFIA